VASDTWSDAGFENGYETKASKLICGMCLVTDSYIEAIKLIYIAGFYLGTL
jgi:hypothetical protein